MKNDFSDEIAIIGDGITAKLVAIAFYQIKIMPILISNNNDINVLFSKLEEFISK